MKRIFLGKDNSNEEYKFLDVDTLFNNFFNEPFGIGFFKGLKAPAIDLYEKDNKVVIEADLPGINKEEIKLNLEGDILTISGQTKRHNEVKRKDFYYSERAFGNIHRSIKLPEGVKNEGLKASYNNGLLTIEMLKGETPERKGGNIEIE